MIGNIQIWSLGPDSWYVAKFTNKVFTFFGKSASIDYFLRHKTLNPKPYFLRQKWYNPPVDLNQGNQVWWNYEAPKTQN
jgi:hypothetical protein